MARTNLCENRKQKKLKHIVGYISGGLAMNDMNIADVSRKTGLKQRTLYEHVRHPESMRLGELVELLDAAGIEITLNYKENMNG